ncbi:MAG: SMC family ATPase [Microcoleus sp. PH2017_04_SCI_O_A]|uniref:AAA family ATPase n=1 Tax=unclassified Microcoleus TaxID=2642155 RepID=UPI001D6B3B5F|nr:MULTISPECIES: SMC family ATPase [unclassified Microcoleus]MCC3430955.1 SMC family ATPase [Microcoleus sp. PH2017_04_SCI_O_A]TAE67490.1 MAG: SMC family ATPase [Oscillatoriales cyanobacterium]MCC3450969.1 SMC family ATPase [Microcoleus sp. PH2017_09_SFU_O_A]MCC3631854.1 SMC family ATPase [Microcoleus sp. PH2017_39_LGB_O_B]MCC3644019.1 SMC family ATPase [Microcoleus sp. PH2017_33_LGB_O_A]
MRPLELLLEGFTSFRREQRLDFSQLDLFAITGATGAGKSSLLDAMTYALFGTTNRSGKQVADLVSQGSENLKVQLRFAVGLAQYRVTRRWRFRPKSPENKVILECWQDGNWETLGTSIVAVQNTIEQILGMDFDTFTRAIILPQGKFDEFIKGDTSKRREILRQLAGFEIFEQMRKEANELAKLLKQEREMVERQLAELSAPAANEVELKRSQLWILEQQLPQFERAVMEAQKAVDEEEQLFSQITRWQELQQELAQLNASSAEITILAQRLERAQAANHLQGDWALLRSARSQYETAESAALSARERLTKARSELATEQQQFEAAKAKSEVLAPQIKAREDALAAAKVYEEQRTQLDKEVALAQKNQQEKLRFLQVADKELQAANTKIQAAGFRVTQVAAMLEKYSPGGKRFEKLQEVAPLLMELQLIAKQVKTQREQLNKSVAEKASAEQNYVQVATNLAAAEIRLKECSAELEAVETANAEAARLESVAAVRMSLNAGDTCPVCGGVHPESDLLPALPISKIVDVAGLRRKVAAANQVLPTAQMAVAEGKSAVFACEQKQSEIALALELTEKRVAQLQQQITQVLENPQWEVLQLQQELVILADSDRQYRETEQQFQLASFEYNNYEQRFNFAATTQAAKQQEYQDAIAESDRRKQQLQSCVNALYQITEYQPYANLAKALAEDKQELANLLTTAEKSYQTAQNTAIQAAEREQQAGEVFAQAQASKQQLNQDWLAKLTAADFTEETFLAAVAPVSEQSQWENAIRCVRESKIQLETRAKDLSEAIAGRTTDEDILAQVRSAKHAAQEKFKQANNNRAELLAWIQVAAQTLEQAERLSQQITNFTEQEQTYHTLAQNLKSNEFQSYILEHLEAELVGSATLILQELTENRYKLKNQDGEYWVADNWNGGEARRVRTLSGGETFATSLSMALALSEKLSQGTQLGSLFLDEGFGTLDAETLESVTQILESLRQRERLIGVITHVRGLGERLPAQVKVFKSPQGSRIEIERV